MTTSPATYTYPDGTVVDVSTGEPIAPPVDFSREVAPYHSPTEEEWITHDYPMRGSALVKTRQIKEIVNAFKDKEDRIRVARQLSLYMDGPTEEAKRFIGKRLRLLGAFEFILPPFEAEDPQTHKKFMKTDAAVQKLYCELPDGRKAMLRFGAESAGTFVAKWTGCFRDFTFEDGDYVDFVLGTEGARNRYTFEEVE